MFLRNALERLARRIWRERWNSIAHAEFRRHFSWRNVAVGAFLVLLSFAIVILVWRYQDLPMASATARVVLAALWFVAIGMCSSQGNRMFLIDARLQVTEAWLLTSEPRDRVLWSRLAGISVPGPLLMIAMLPLYYLAALGLPPGGGPLFVCGHLARAGAAYESIPPGAAALIAAVPVAALALLADIVAPPAFAAVSLPRSLYRTASGRLALLPFLGVFTHPRLFLINFSVAFVMLLSEGLVAVGAAYWAWGASTWKLSGWTDAGLNLVLSCVFAGLLIALRWTMAHAAVGMTARHYDQTLITDEPC